MEVIDYFLFFVGYGTGMRIRMQVESKAQPASQSVSQSVKWIYLPGWLMLAMTDGSVKAKSECERGNPSAAKSRNPQMKNFYCALRKLLSAHQLGCSAH